MRRLLVLLALLLVAARARAVVVCPGKDTVEGIDVSQWQGNINWGQVKGDGIHFAIIRVSDGLGHVDPYFDQNWQGAKAAGLIRGVYQFFEPGQDAVAQANLLLNKMGPLGPGDLPPMIDVEATGGQTPQTITAKIHQWIDVVEAATGRKPLIYTGTWFWDPKVGSNDFASYPLVESWYCNNCCPNLPTPWSTFKMWQYSSSGAVAGIGGAVDLDKFNGSLADLQAFAGNADWGARFVAQSFPFATDPLVMTVNQALPASIEMKNTGRQAWDGNTRIATTGPRDRASAFAAADWIGPNRPAGCDGGAAPGATCKFSFTFRAPDAPGDYKEFFGMVQEGVAWFSDPGQGGPPDLQLEAWIRVVEADYHAQWVAQSFPAADEGAAMLTVGETQVGWIELRNVGLKPWRAGETKLAPTPRDQASPLADPTWLSPTRVSTLAKDVAPGEVGRFALPLRGATAGSVEQTFALVEEGVTWFADAPLGGGPADDLLRVRVEVSAPAPKPDAGHGPDGGSAPPSGMNGEIQGGCAIASARGSGAPLALLAAALLALYSRRRRPYP